jgi:hypothetical protein
MQVPMVPNLGTTQLLKYGHPLGLNSQAPCELHFRLSLGTRLRQTIELAAQKLDIELNSMLHCLSVHLLAFFRSGVSSTIVTKSNSGLGS